MCTVIKKTQKGHPKTAKENIIVYKACNSIAIISKTKVRSISEGFIYIKNRLNKTRFSYSSQVSYSDTIEGDYCSKLNDPLFIAKGFHSYIDEERLKEWDGDYNCKFIIPKDAKYYENEVGNIVSNQIIFKEIL